MSTTEEVKTNNPPELNISAYVPIVTSGLIFLGVSRLIFYYAFFSINILSFLDFGEIITSFLDTIVVSIVLVLSLMLQFQPPYKKQDQNYASPLSKWQLYALLIIILMIAGALLYFFISITLKDLKFVKIFIIYGGVGAIIIYFFRRQYKNHRTKLIRQISFLGMILIGSEIFIMLLTIQEYRGVKINKKFEGTIIEFNKDTYLDDSSNIHISGKNSYYIGKTNNYLFIHHLDKKVTSVYPMSCVKRIDFKNRAVTKSWLSNLRD